MPSRIVTLPDGKEILNVKAVQLHSRAGQGVGGGGDDNLTPQILDLGPAIQGHGFLGACNRGFKSKKTKAKISYSLCKIGKRKDGTVMKNCFKKHLSSCADRSWTP